MLHIHPLIESDIPAALRLSTQAKWNQIDQDWLRLIHCWPDSCLGAWSDQQLIATVTLARFGSVGWLGMVLVDEARRGQGVGGRMFAAGCRLADELGITTLGLDATDEGRPIYLKRGFVDHSFIERWRGMGGGSPVGGGVRPMTDSDEPAVLALDQRAMDVSRALLLREMFGEPGALAYVCEHEGTIHGFALARRGRTATMIGPVVAEDTSDAENLVAKLLAGIQGAVFIDLTAGQSLAGTLSVRGFSCARKLTRMSRPLAGGALLNGSYVFAGAGLELG